MKVAWNKAETREANNNESNDRLLEDRVTIEVLPQPPRTNSYQRSCSRDLQKVKYELKKVKAVVFSFSASCRLSFHSFLFWFTKFRDSSFDTDSATNTSSVRIGNSRNASKTVTELVGCPTKQSAIPDLPSALVGHDVGLLIQEDHVLVFGGTSGGTSDQGYDSRTCIAFTLGSQHWVAFNHTMGRPRILTLSKTVGNPKRYLTFKTRMKVGSLSPCQVRWIMSAFRQNLFLKFCVFE